MHAEYLSYYLLMRCEISDQTTGEEFAQADELMIAEDFLEGTSANTQKVLACSGYSSLVTYLGLIF